MEKKRFSGMDGWSARGPQTPPPLLKVQIRTRSGAVKKNLGGLGGPFWVKYKGYSIGNKNHTLRRSPVADLKGWGGAIPPSQTFSNPFN